MARQHRRSDLNILVKIIKPKALRSAVKNQQNWLNVCSCFFESRFGCAPSRCTGFRQRPISTPPEVGHWPTVKLAVSPIWFTSDIYGFIWPAPAAAVPQPSLAKGQGLACAVTPLLPGRDFTVKSGSRNVASQTKRWVVWCATKGSSVLRLSFFNISQQSNGFFATKSSPITKSRPAFLCVTTTLVESNPIELWNSHWFFVS